MLDKGGGIGSGDSDCHYARRQEESDFLAKVVIWRWMGGGGGGVGGFCATV